jgi:hypothetical protein
MGLLLMGCGGTEAAHFPTASSLPDDERRPDGIAVDLTSAPPSASDSASSNDSIVTLRTPLSSNAAQETVRQFFEAITAEDISQMSRVVQSSAIAQDMRVKQRNTRTHGVTALWRQRFRKREYQLLSSRVVYREGDVMTYRGAELDSLPLEVRYLPNTEPSHPTDLVLHVPIATHTIKNERLLGDDLFFWLRRVDDRYVIYRMAEDIPF